MFVIVAVMAAWGFSSVPAAVGQNKTSQVLVVNGSSQPVPTAAQGTTNIAGTVNLSSGSTVNIGNTPSVNVSSTPSVNVANTPTVNLSGGSAVTVSNPLDSQNNPSPLAALEATQPYEDFCSLFFSGAAGSCNFQTIPASKRLVIQEFDTSGTLETGLKPLSITVQTTGFLHFFPATPMGSAKWLRLFCHASGNASLCGLKRDTVMWGIGFQRFQLW
jgi:hypothetical protein